MRLRLNNIIVWVTIQRRKANNMKSAILKTLDVRGTTFYQATDSETGEIISTSQQKQAVETVVRISGYKLQG